MLHMPNPMLLAASEAAPGQAQWSSSGTLNTTWVVPADVYSISGVCIGRGEDAYLDQGIDVAASGTGGSLRYVNAIPVTPGETLSIQINGDRSAVLRNATILIGASSGVLRESNNVGTGFNGGRKVQGGYYSSATGAGAGGYTSAGATSTNGSRGGGGSSLLGGGAGASTGASGDLNGLAFGGGGGVIWNSGIGLGGPGGIRIIWGPGRAYPNTNTGDVA